MNGKKIKLPWRHYTTIFIYSENFDRKKEDQKNEAQNL